MKRISIEEEELLNLRLGELTDLDLPLGKNDDSLDRSFNLGIEFMRDTVQRRFGLERGGRCLDLLGGVGRWAIFLAEWSSEVVLLERVEGFVEIGRKLSQRCGHENIKFLQGDVSEISNMESESFDVIWIWSGMQYVEREMVLAQCNRLLCPGGKLVVGAYNSVGIMLEHVANGVESNALFEGASAWALEGLAKGPGGDGVPNYTTIDECDSLCSRFGFNLLGVAPSNQLDLDRTNQKTEGGASLNNPPRTVEFVATPRR